MFDHSASPNWLQTLSIRLYLRLVQQPLARDGQLRTRVSQVLHIVPVGTQVADAKVLGVPFGHAGAD